MNFKQIQAIFMLTFVLLNLFLLKLFLDRGALTAIETVDFDIITELKSKYIFYKDVKNKDISLSSVNQYLPYITSVSKQETLKSAQEVLKNVTFVYDNQKDKISATLLQPIPLTQTDTLSNEDLNQLILFLKNDENVYNGKDYIFLGYYPLRKEIVFTQVIDGIPIVEDNTKLVFLVDAQQIVGYYQEYTENLTKENDSRALISEKEAISTLYLSSLLPESSLLEQPKLVYQKMTIVDNITVYSPVWYVNVKMPNDIYTFLRVDALVNIPLIATDK